MGQLDGKVALITGGGRGQGRSHALKLAGEGADIAICDVPQGLTTPHYALGTADDLRTTEKLVLETGRRCVAVEADVRDRAAMARFVDQTVSELGGIDIVCANAGIFSFGSVVDTTWDQWDETIGVVLTGVFNTVKLCAPHMIAAGKGGAIVITSSNAGLTPIPGVSPYVSGKHGVTGLMKVLAVELAEHNIRVNCVHPCGVRTDMVMNQAGLDVFAGKAGATFEETVPAMKSLNLLPIPLIEPEDVSNAVLFLVADTGRYMTGSSLLVDAGTTICPPGTWRGTLA
jgi:(+)-trans-carveol dehydrogenase